MTFRKKLPKAQQIDLRVPQVAIQPASGEIDKLIDVLAHAWNEQAYDRQAFDYFQGVSWEKPQMLIESLYRYPEGNRVVPGDREFLARQLKELADAIYAAVARWM